MVDGAIYSTDGVENEEGKCYASRAGRYCAMPYYWGEEES